MARGKRQVKKQTAIGEPVTLSELNRALIENFSRAGFVVSVELDGDTGQLVAKPAPRVRASRVAQGSDNGAEL